MHETDRPPPPLDSISDPQSEAKLEAAATEARNTFGDTLPPGYLSPEELKIYKRLYGTPVEEPLPDDAELLEGFGDETAPEGQQEPALYRKGDSGELEEVELASEIEESRVTSEDDAFVGRRLEDESEEEFEARATLLRDIEAANRAEAEAYEENEDEQQTARRYEETEYEGPELDEAEQEHDESGTRTHPYTGAGRFGSFPSSISLPEDTFIRPVRHLLTGVSNRQLAEFSKRTFGGPFLPDSVATPSSKGKHLQQKPIALEASQSHMGVMESCSFIAANMPGAYASVMSTLVETRKRLGSSWIEGLLQKEGGPRVLDAGAAGAGILAWHEVLRAEWARMHPDESPLNPTPLGKATIITGSHELRRRVSTMLENTTFLPRMQDFMPARDLPGSPSHDPTLRKQYDLIIAPYTLWQLKEDYMRRNLVQNYFTLLNPNGGVLIIIEKGVPRGFELVAGAREVLLKHHLVSSDNIKPHNEMEDVKQGWKYTPEPGMIIAPCTNHQICPMYRTPGAMVGRKDFCHFEQRFVRPPFLQRIHGITHHNHEDIKFSYVAVRRGIDDRYSETSPKGEEATLAALKGYEESKTEPSPYSLPRLLAPALKRHRHVTFDICTPAASLERWTVPKSFSKQGYRDARKSRWGDLWALGAKTRVVRNARSGTARPRPKRHIQIGVGATESQDIIRDLTQGMQGRKDKTGRKRTKQPRKLTDDDLM